MSDGEVTDSDGEVEVGGSRNTNAEEVVRAEREKREKDKEDSQRKKEKDKEDRYSILLYLSGSSIMDVLNIHKVH